MDRKPPEIQEIFILSRIMNESKIALKTLLGALFVLAAFTVGASAEPAPYAGLGAAATFGSGHPTWMTGVRGKHWRAELGGHILDRERGKTAATGTLGTTITAERYDLRTRFFYTDLSWRLLRKDTAKPSGLEFGFGTALLRVVKDTRIEFNTGAGEYYSHDVVWKVTPLLRVAYVRPTEGPVEFGFDGRLVMSGNSHGGKNIGGWSFALSARFYPFSAGM